MRKRLEEVTTEEKQASVYPEELDGRTVVAKQFNEFRDKLIAYCGGEPSILELAVIDEAAWIWMRCQALHSKIAAGQLNDLESRQYSTWSNNLSRLLLRLHALVGSTPKVGDTLPPSLADLFPGTDDDSEAA